MTHDHVHQLFKKGYNQTECNLTKVELHSSVAQNLCSVAENNMRRKLLNP